ncbi:copper resistance CopC family protein [Nocardioides sp.]|uniref:copper resistance CopC family protein n=1 Tax=Nocardioides sp. TaxID=35761 RepID=UPI003D0A7029
MTLSVAPAWAHATLVASTPTQGAVLQALPEQVEFEFSQDISSPAYVIVTAPDGSSVTSGTPRVDGAFVRQGITDGPGGTYTMAYRAVSEDGHPVTGEITFTVGEGTTAATTEADAGPDAAPAQGADSAGRGSPPGASWWSRHGMQAGVGAGLFLIAALLLVLSRRPVAAQGRADSRHGSESEPAPPP